MLGIFYSDGTDYGYLGRVCYMLGLWLSWVRVEIDDDGLGYYFLEFWVLDCYFTRVGIITGYSTEGSSIFLYYYCFPLYLLTIIPCFYASFISFSL